MSRPKAFNTWTPEQQEDWLEKRREYLRKWAAANRKKNPEKVADNQRKWRASNPEKVTEGERKWRASNPEKVAESQRKHYAANVEKFAEKQRKYRAANPEKVTDKQRKYREANPNYYRKYRAAIRQQDAADQFFVMVGAAQQISEAIGKPNKKTT